MQNRNIPSIANKSTLIEGLNIAYKDEGSGQILLCLHAIGHSSKDFTCLYSLNKKTYRVINIDFPGQGKSDKPKQNISATYFATIVRGFILKLGLKDVIIIGNSIGGATAIRVASNNSNIKMLSLSNPGGLDKRGFIAPLFLNYMVNFFQKGVDKNPHFQQKFEKYYNKILITIMAEERKNEITKNGYEIAPILVQAWKSFKSQEEDLRPLIYTVNCPVLFTWGVKDKFIRFGRNKKAIEKFKNYKLIKYEIGHTPYIECPDKYLKDFQEFMKTY